MNRYIVGASFGFGGIEAVLLDENFVAVEKVARPFIPKLGRESIIAKIEKAVTSLPSFHLSSALGVCFPATFDKSGKKIIDSPIEGLQGADVYQMLSKKLNMPIYTHRREFCSILAEQAFGVAKQYQNVVLVEIGRDVGAALLISGKIYRGSNNAAGNIADMVVDITREKRHAAGTFGDLVSGHGVEALTGKSIYEMLGKSLQNENVSKQILRDLKESLLTGLTNMKFLFDPEIFILSGDIIDNFSAFKPALVELGVKVEKSKIGRTAPAIGAAIAAYNASKKSRVR